MFLFRSLSCSVLLATGVSAESTGVKDPVLALLDRQDLGEAKQDLVEQSVKEAVKPIIVRPESLEELQAKYRSVMKYPEKPAHQAHLSDAEWERFALSLGDANLNGVIAERLPRFAASYLFSKDERLADHVRAQLSEMAKWKPLERPGTVSTRQNLTFSPWLGTGWAIRGITETLEIMPQDAIPAELRKTLIENMEAEIGGIRQAWKAQNLWYTKE